MSTDRVRLELDMPSGHGPVLTIVTLDGIGVAYGNRGCITHRDWMTAGQLRDLSTHAADMAAWLDGSRS